MEESPSKRNSERSYAAYLQDVAGGSMEEGFRRLDNSGSSCEEIQTSQLETPRTINSSVASPQATEARSFVNGVLSPFSPLLKDHDTRDEFLQHVSLQPCRKVSVIVRVMPSDSVDQRCVFPHLKNAQPNFVHKSKTPRDMVVVNPTAFGKFIPSQVTMETARLVAQVAHISSEDWARLYEFHHVMWPSSEEKEQSSSDDFSTIDSLSHAVVQDALVEHQSSLILSMGQVSSCIGTEDSILPKIISQIRTLMGQKAVCTLSMVEVLEEEDIFCDLLNKRNKLSIRHVDMKGAILEGLTQASIEEIPALLDSVIKRKSVQNLTVATLNIWENAVSQQLNKQPTAQITCVELSSASQQDQSTNVNTVASTRKNRSAVCLGLALRQLLLHASLGTDPAISYRESTLTKLLQRSLESSKIVLVASISQSAKEYQSTLVTLNYLRRLLVKPGKTASSPFKENKFDHDEVDKTATPGKLQQYADSGHLLEKLVSDPRQRLAKIFKQSPARQSGVELETAPSQEDYHPIDYMQGLGGPPQNSPAESPLSADAAISKSRKEITMPLREEKKRTNGVSKPQDLKASSGDFLSRRKEYFYPDYTEDTEDHIDNEKIKHRIVPSNGNENTRGDEHWEAPISIVETTEGQENMNNHEGSSEFRTALPEHYEVDHYFIGEKSSVHGHRHGSNSKDSIPVGKSSEGTSTLDHSYSTHQNLVEAEAEGESWTGWSSKEDELREEAAVASNSRHDLQETSFNMFHTGSHNDLSADDSLISKSHSKSSREQVSRTTNPTEFEGSQDERSHSSSPSFQGIKLDVESRQRSAFDSISHQKFGRSPPSSTMLNESKSIAHETDSNFFNGKLPRSEDEEQYNFNHMAGEIEVLEGAVNQIQYMQSGLWESSAKSLQRLKEAFALQRRDMSLLTNQREKLEANVASLRDEVRRQSEIHDSDIQWYEDEVQQVQKQLEYAASKNKLLEATASEAEAQMASVQAKFETIEIELIDSREAANASEKAYEEILSSRKHLQEEVVALRTKFELLGREKDNWRRNYAELENKFERIEDERVHLKQERNSTRLTMEHMSEQVRRLERESQIEKANIKDLEAAKAEKMRVIDELSAKMKRLQASFDHIQEEKTNAESIRRQEAIQTRELEVDHRELKRSYERLREEHSQCTIELLEWREKVSLLKDEVAKKDVSIENLRSQCGQLEFLRGRDGSDKTFWEEQSRKLDTTVKDFKAEREILHEAQLKSKLEIKHLEKSHLEREEEWAIMENRLQEEIRNLKKAKNKLEHSLQTMKAVELDKANSHSMEVSSLRDQIAELQSSSLAIEERGGRFARGKDDEVAKLVSAMDRYKTDLNAAYSERLKLQRGIQAADMREQDLLQRLKESEKLVERYRQDMVRAASEEKKLHREQHDLEIEQIRRDVLEKSSKIKNLSRDLERSELQNRHYEEKLTNMTKTMKEIQLDTRDQVGHFIGRHKDSAGFVTSLEEQNRKLRSRLRRIEHEKDALYKCLQSGRERLEMVSKKETSTNGFLAVGNRFSSNFRPAIDKLPSGASSELYLTAHPLDQLYSLRAEEIAACLALSAKASLQDSQNEASNLRSQVYQLEEEKEAEVAALKTRIIDLEREVLRDS